MSINEEAVQWDGLPMPNRIWAAIALMSAVGLGVLDGVILNIALPSICESLAISASSSIWIVNSYQIAVIVSLLPLSTLGDFVGYRKICIAGLAIFTLSSIGCALSWDFYSLVLFRILQGFGASAIMSVNTSIVRLTYPKRMLGQGLGINSTIVSVSSVAGPSLAAAVLAVGPWPWLFAINIPIGVLSIVLSYLYLPHNPTTRDLKGYKKRDAALNALSFGLLFAVFTGFTHGVSWTIIAIEVVALIIVGYIFIKGQQQSETPILPFDLLRIPIFTLSIATSILSFVTQMSIMVAMPFILQRQWGYSTLEVGAIITAWPIVNLFTTPISGMLVDKYDAKVLGSIGLIVLSIGVSLLAFMPSEPTKWEIMIRLAICGLGFGFFQSPNNNIIITSAPLSRSGSASGMMATARLSGQILGAAVVAMLFYILPQDSLSDILYVSAAFSIAAMVMTFFRLSTR